MRISDWSSDVCSSDLALLLPRQQERVEQAAAEDLLQFRREVIAIAEHGLRPAYRARQAGAVIPAAEHALEAEQQAGGLGRSEEHTSELQSLMRISYAVFCLKKKT